MNDIERAENDLREHRALCPWCSQVEGEYCDTAVRLKCAILRAVVAPEEKTC